MRASLAVIIFSMLAMPIMAVCCPLMYFWSILCMMGMMAQLWDIEDRSKFWGYPIDLLERRLPKTIEIPE